MWNNASICDQGTITNMHGLLNCKQAKKDVRKNYYATSHFFEKCLEAYLRAAYDHYDGENGELNPSLRSTVSSRLIRIVQASFHNTLSDCWLSQHTLFATKIVFLSMISIFISW